MASAQQSSGAGNTQDQLASEVYALTGYNFNIGSAVQVGKAVYEKLAVSPPAGLEPGKSGRYSVTSDVLKKILKEQQHLRADQTRALQLILDWRAASKTAAPGQQPTASPPPQRAAAPPSTPLKTSPSTPPADTSAHQQSSAQPKNIASGAADDRAAPPEGRGRRNLPPGWLGLPPRAPASYQGKGPMFAVQARAGKEAEAPQQRSQAARKSGGARAAAPAEAAAANGAAAAQPAATDAATAAVQSAAAAPAAAAAQPIQGAKGGELLIFDGHYLLYRSFYALPRLTSRAGTHVGAVVGLCNAINKVVLDRIAKAQDAEDADLPRVAFVFDKTGGSTARNQLYPEYKAQRKDTPPELVPQFSLARQAVEAYGLPVFEVEGYEADDTIATLTTHALAEGASVTIVSADKDLQQLVGGSVRMLDSLKMAHITTETVEQMWGVPPALLGDLLALAGDAADNLPGVPSIGRKTAASLLQEYGSLSAILEAAAAGEQQGAAGSGAAKKKGGKGAKAAAAAAEAAAADADATVAPAASSPPQQAVMPKSAKRTKLHLHASDALLTRQLVQLDCAVPLPNGGLAGIPHYRVHDTDRLIAFFAEHGLQDLERRTAKLLGIGKGASR